jgi:hypothetical protein
MPSAATNILIFGDNTAAVTTSCEYKLITSGMCSGVNGLGWSATVAATSTTATQSYANYDAVLLSQCCTWGGFETFGAAGGPDANPGWANSVHGNVIVIGTDPGYSFHTGQGPASAQMIKSALQFAASGTQTGAVVLLNGYYMSSGADTPMPALAGFETVSGGNCGNGRFRAQGAYLNEAHKIATHPALSGLSDSLLSGWGYSSHSGFNCWPAGFTPLALVSDLAANDTRVNWTGTDVETGGSVKGFPYIVARGVTPAMPPREIDCCSPLDKPTVNSMLSEVPTGTINQNYIVRFQTNPTFDLQMQNYFNYANSMNTTIVGAEVILALFDCGDNLVPGSAPCSGTLMPGVKLLSWNATSANAPWRSEWNSSWVNSCSPSFSSNCIGWTDIFASTQQSAVNHRYQILAFTTFYHANGTREILWRCPIVTHEVNHMQSLKVAQQSVTRVISQEEFQRSPGGRKFLEEFARISRARPAPMAMPHKGPSQPIPEHDHQE